MLVKDTLALTLLKISVKKLLPAKQFNYGYQYLKQLIPF